MRRERLLVCVAVVCSLRAAVAPADTGTYEINRYRVTLAPRADGATEITYYQKWAVTGGEIPWVTVGTPNSSYVILPASSKHAAAKVKSANGSGWSGVRIDLDRTYLPGETFEVGFKIAQRYLFDKDGHDYRFDFTPGWYDRGKTGELEIRLEFFGELKGVTARPEPDETTSNSMTWRRTSLAGGAKVPIRVMFPAKLFPGPIDLASEKKSGGAGFPFIIVVFGCGIVLLLVKLIIRGGRGGYGGGGRIGSTGHYVHTCACACVACACACACAGGGAAGCDRKLTRTCPLCKDCENEDCQLRKGRNSAA